jgi:16S rRNA C1402 (ribose-2'-O) methylase RsmI
VGGFLKERTIRMTHAAVASGLLPVALTFGGFVTRKQASRRDI